MDICNWSLILYALFLFFFLWSPRLAPQYPFPVPYEDVVSVVKYFLQDKILAKYGVDPNRICISGDSSGGTLAAGVAQLVSCMCYMLYIFINYIKIIEFLIQKHLCISQACGLSFWTSAIIILLVHGKNNTLLTIITLFFSLKYSSRGLDSEIKC